MEPVKGQYGVRIPYSVIDPNYPDKPKKFEASKLTSRKVDSLLGQGKTLLKITREGRRKTQVIELKQPTNLPTLFLVRITYSTNYLRYGAMSVF